MQPRHGLRAAAFLAAAFSAGTPALLAQVWNQRFPAASPPAINSARMVYDSARAVMVLFGGSMGGPSSDQTWEYDGINWTQANPANRPSPRYAHALAFDMSRGVTVLFGGQVGSGESNETWEYDGVDWTLITTTGAPSARSGSEMVHDLRTRRIVLLAGSSGNTRHGDTWEYDGATKTWTQMTNAGTPHQAIQFAMAYDIFRGKTIVFGGVNANFGLLNTTWEYDSGTKTWTEVIVSGTVPRTRRLLRGAFDTQRRVLVVHGGDVLPGELSDTWEYDGVAGTWTDTTVSGTGPVLNREYAMAYDSRRSTVVLWGGITNNMRTNWTWEYGTRGTFRSFGAGCRGSSAIGIPALTATSAGPIIGRVMDTRVAPAPNGGIMFVGFSNQRHESGLPLPIDLSSLGAVGCRLYVSTHLIVPVAGASGVMDFSLPIPLDLNLSGVAYYQQAFVLDPGINPLQHVLSNAGEATIL
jgi:hypothetical protein